MSKHNDVVCIQGECSDIQTTIVSMVNDGYEIMDIHSQFIVNDKGYDKAKSVVWLQKNVEVTHGKR